MLNSIFSCFRFIRSIHRGLYDSWLFGFFANDDPSALVKPEYIATVMVGESIVNRFIKIGGSSGLSLKLEAPANMVATHCFSVPPFPLKKRTVPSRSSRNGQEKIDVTVFDSQLALTKVSRAIVELKLLSNPCHLKADLLRNMKLMELHDLNSINRLQIACLGFIVVDNNSLCAISASKFRSKIKNRYMALVKQYASNKYITHISVRELSSPPESECEVGVFIHMASVVISFIRI